MNQRQSTVNSLPQVAMIHADRSPGGLLCADVKSFSVPQSRYAVAVDPKTMRVYCSCPDHLYRHEKHSPTIADTNHLCKHALAFLPSLIAELIEGGAK